MIVTATAVTITVLCTQEIHSKLKTMAFPDFEEVVRIVQETSKGAEPTPVRSIDVSFRLDFVKINLHETSNEY